MKTPVQLQHLTMALGLLTWAASAGLSLADTTTTPTFRTEPGPAPVYEDKPVAPAEEVVRIFNGNEWSLDVFGLYAVEAKEGTYDDGFGAGVGVNYFFNRYFGLGLEGYGWKGDGLIRSVSGNILVRYPIEAWHMAPYFIGGIGGNFGADHTDDQINASAGLGLEVRFSEHWGVIADGRYVVTDESNDYGLARLGVRFTF